jgi:hypothetical protein
VGTISVVWLIVLFPFSGLAVFIAANLVVGEKRLTRRPRNSTPAKTSTSAVAWGFC